MDFDSIRLQNLRFGLYARKSTEDRNRQIQSIESQLDVLIETAEKEHLTIIKTYKDNASAHKPSNRPAFAEMLNDLNKGVIEAILCWKADRLARNHLEGGMLMHCLQTNIIKVIKTPYKSFLPNDNVLPLTIEFGMANQYSRDLSRNVKRGNKTKIQKGGFCNTAPQGYLNDKLNKTIIIDPIRFPLIRKMWDLMLSKSYSIRQICDIANTKWGYTTPLKSNMGGKKISVGSLHRIFSNPFYKGLVRNGSNTNKGIHVPMVTDVEFEKVQQIMDKKGRKGKTSYTFALTGKISCGECGQCITAEEKISYSCPQCRSKQSAKTDTKCRKCGYQLTQESRQDANRYTYYRCRKKAVQGQKKCSQPCICASKLEAQVEETLLQTNINPLYAEFMKNKLKYFSEEHSDNHNDHKELFQKKIEKIMASQSRLLDLYLDGKLTEEQFNQKDAELKETKINLEKQLLFLSDANDNWFSDAKEDLDLMNLFHEKWKTGDAEMKKRLFHKLCSNPILTDKKLRIDLKPIFIEHKLRSNQFQEVLEMEYSHSMTSENPHEMMGCSAWSTNLEEIRTHYLTPRENNNT